MLREETERLLRLHGLEADSSRDEQQLVDPQIIDDLLDAAGVSRGDTVIEVGPGAGNITSRLLAREATVYAVEKNPKWRPLLDSLLGENPRFHLTVGDALTIRLPPADKIVSNLPYSISEAFYQRLTRLPFRRAAFIVPQGFAETVTAEEGGGFTKLSFISSLFFSAKIVRSIPRGAYLPEPDVDTCILAVEPRDAALPSERILRELCRQQDKKTWNALREAVTRAAPPGDTRSTKRGAEDALKAAGVKRTDGRVARLSLAELKTLKERLRSLNTTQPSPQTT